MASLSELLGAVGSSGGAVCPVLQVKCSAMSLSAAVAPDVKIKSYSSAVVLKCSKILKEQQQGIISDYCCYCKVLQKLLEEIGEWDYYGASAVKSCKI